MLPFEMDTLDSLTMRAQSSPSDRPFMMVCLVARGERGWGVQEKVMTPVAVPGPKFASSNARRRLTSLTAVCLCVSSRSLICDLFILVTSVNFLCNSRNQSCQENPATSAPAPFATPANHITRRSLQEGRMLRIRSTAAGHRVA